MKNINKGRHEKAVFLITLGIVITLGMIPILLHFIPSGVSETDERQYYDRYYMMITADNTSFWQSVYEGAKSRAIESGVYIDWLDNELDANYEIEDMMRMAIASSVDGIVVMANTRDSVTELINEAADNGIPVVTLYSDDAKSKRCSFVGVGSYNLGKEYGRKALEIIRHKENAEGDEAGAEKKVSIALLVNSYSQNLDQNILCAGIQEIIDQEFDDNIETELKLLTVDDTNAFSVEESIRDIFLEDNLPDIIICLNELNTTCVYQAVVDYNRVGQVDILGYYDSDTILNGVSRGVITATVSVDTEQMGKYCIDALEEYTALGYTSQYLTADITLITQDNVADYLKEEGNEDGQ